MAEDTERRWRDRDIDNALMLELASGAPSDVRIRDLVGRGADVNSVKGHDSILNEAMRLSDHGALDERFLRLLVELGADLTCVSDERGCLLYEATYMGSQALVEFFLQHGANPNAILDDGETVLDSVEFDVRYHTEEAGENWWSTPASREWDAEEVRRLTEVAAILKRYGGKNLGQLRVDEVSGWIGISGWYETGLLTEGGGIEVDAIGALTESFASDFKAWKAAYWHPWPEDWSSKPALFDRAGHNEWGRRLARVIRAALPPEIKVRYETVNAEEEEKKIRKVDWETIE